MSIKRNAKGYSVECNVCENPIVHDQPNAVSAVEAFTRAGGFTYEDSYGDTSHKCAVCRKAK